MIPAITVSMMTSMLPSVHTPGFYRGAADRLRGSCRKAPFGDDNSLHNIDVLGLVHWTAQDIGNKKRREEGGGTHFEWQPRR